MTNSKIRKRSLQSLCVMLLLLLIAMEIYSLAGIALDRTSPHRPWWEYCGIALAWIMLAALLIGLPLLLSSRRSTKGFALVIVNIAVYYGIISFEIFAYEKVNRLSFDLLAIYSGIAIVEFSAAVGLRKLASPQNTTIKTEVI